MESSPQTSYRSLIREILDVSSGKQIDDSVYELDDEDNLFDLGLTSIGFISMIIEFEDRLDIVFEEEEFELENFNTIAAIQAEIVRKMAEKQSQGDS